MPSVYQSAGARTYEPSQYADEFDEDPARFLSFGKRFAFARVDGITDVDLLRAYADVEARRDRRRSVIKRINNRIVDLEDEESG